MRPHRWQPTRPLPVPGILQARTLEWVAISFSNAWKWKVKVKLLSCVRLLVTQWTAAYQAPRSMDFTGKATGVGCHWLVFTNWWVMTCHVQIAELIDGCISSVKTTKEERGKGMETDKNIILWSVWPRDTFGDMYAYVCVHVCTQSCPTLSDPMDCSLPDSCVHGIFQARIWGYVAMSSSSGTFWPKSQTQVSCVSCTDRWMLYHCATWGVEVNIFPLFSRFFWQMHSSNQHKADLYGLSPTRLLCP